MAGEYRREDDQAGIFKSHTASRLAERAKALQERVRQQASGKRSGKAVAPGGLDRERGASRVPDSPGTNSPIFFVVGYQKSGTTWLMKMLDAHPEILCRGEGRPFGRNWRQEHLKKRRGSYPPTSLYNAMLSAEDLRYWVERSIWSRGDDTDEHLANLTGLAVEYFLTRRLSKTGKKFVGDKTVLLDPGIIREISVICPEARVIHIIRDGRDAAISAMHQRWNAGEDRGGSIKTTPDQIAKREAYREDPQVLLQTDDGMFPEGWISRSAARWRARVARTVEDGPALLGQNYAEVRYEDLLADPEGQLARLLGFLGAERGEEAVGECVGAAAFERLSGGRKRGQEGASFYRKGISGDWKNVFTEKNKREFKAAAGDLLVRMGYERDDDW